MARLKAILLCNILLGQKKTGFPQSLKWTSDKCERTTWSWAINPSQHDSDPNHMKWKREALLKMNDRIRFWLVTRASAYLLIQWTFPDLGLRVLFDVSLVIVAFSSFYHTLDEEQGPTKPYDETALLAYQKRGLSNQSCRVRTQSDSMIRLLKDLALSLDFDW